MKKSGTIGIEDDRKIFLKLLLVDKNNFKRLNKMDLHVGVPIFTQAGRDVLSERERAFENWHKKHREQIRKRYKITNVMAGTLSPDRPLQFYVNEGNVIEVKYPPVVTKGLAIRFHILAILDSIDRYSPAHRDDSYYIMIDGSGAFDYSNIFYVLDKLCGIPRFDVVLGKRPEKESGMAIWRKNVELFEEYLIYQKFGNEYVRCYIEDKYSSLPDSQAGCWGLRLGVMKHLPLTARSYEIEYDLLFSALENKIEIGFTKTLQMAVRTATDFGTAINESAIKQCISKLDFITHRLGYEKRKIPKIVQEYLNKIKQNPEKMLPNEYIEGIKDFAFSYYV